MGAVYMLWWHRPAPGRGKVYAKVATEEAMPWLNKQVESGLVKSVKVLRCLSGKDGSIFMAEFANLLDAQKYLKSFEESGLATKYKNMSDNNETVFLEEFEEKEIQEFFDVLMKMD